EQRLNLLPMYGGGPNSRYNLDGYLTYSMLGDSTDCRSYTQFFRSGAIEAVACYGMQTGDQVLPVGAVERHLLESLHKYFRAYVALGVEAPIVLLVSLRGVKGLFVPAGRGTEFQHPFDRDTLLLPDLLVEDMTVDSDALLKPAFDALWQASGWMRCFSY